MTLAGSLAGTVLSRSCRSVICLSRARIRRWTAVDSRLSAAMVMARSVQGADALALLVAFGDQGGEFGA
jgi:hypothetical protein